MKGKFIVIYGINNIGKTTQAKLLTSQLKKKGIKAEYIKYPIYAEEPAGKLIDEYLRKGNPHDFSPREFQMLHFIDRMKFEPNLKEKLSKGINIIAEDYFGTAVAWGLATGVEEKLLNYLYEFILKEDLAILLDGKIFKRNIEKNNKHEINKKLAIRARKAHLSVAKKYGWKKINANGSREGVNNVVSRRVFAALGVKNDK